jgi:D-alanine-D-alanine ligase
MDKLVVILYGKLSATPQADELDIFDEIKIVKDSLQELGYKVLEHVFDLNLEQTKAFLIDVKPDFVFNLVETIENYGDLNYIAPILLENLKIPYSGATVENLVQTTNKVSTKQILRSLNIPTADWYHLHEIHKINTAKRYILKPMKEDGSLGLDEHSVFYGNDVDYIRSLVQLDPKSFFVEEYIAGREFNISVLGGKAGPEVLPMAEMTFANFEGDKPKIMGFTAKWKEDSFEYANTSRTFDIPASDIVLVKKMNDFCIKCWDAFDARGYIRVDFRVDENSNPFVIEVNGNPCLSEGSGFHAAAERAGYSFTDAMKRIIEDIYL